MSNTAIFVTLAAICAVISATISVLALCRASKLADKAHDDLKRSSNTPSTRPTNTSTLSFCVPPFTDCADQRALTHPTDWLKVAHCTAIGFFAVVMGPLFASGAAYVVATLWGRL